MKKILYLLTVAAIVLSLSACGEKNNTTNTKNDDNSEVLSENTSSTADNYEVSEEPQEVVIPNNGEWDEILCSGDGYHLVKKEVDAYDGYKFTLGVVDDNGNWVREMTDTGKFVKEVRFRAEGDSQTLRDSSCYMYLGEGVFLASPGVSVYTKDEEYRVGPWDNIVSNNGYSSNPKVSIWECLIWNVIDDIQVEFKASKISTFQDGYALFCSEDWLGSGVLSTINTSGEITKLDCQYLPNKPGHKFTVYSEGLFYSCSTGRSNPGFYNIDGEMVIDLSQYNVGRIPYSTNMGVNAPYFENGQATILFSNNAESVFRAVIDKTGAFVGEPEKTDIKVY